VVITLHVAAFSSLIPGALDAKDVVISVLPGRSVLLGLVEYMPVKQSRRARRRPRVSPSNQASGLVMIGMMYVTDGDKAAVRRWIERFR
jgi:hypothetical protein